MLLRNYYSHFRCDIVFWLFPPPPKWSASFSEVHPAFFLCEVMGCVGFLPEQYQVGQESELGHGKAGYAGVLCTALPLYDAFKTL